jgi:pyruvate/2-oxoglutarate/acetoin dehydrogenase E1 component
MRFLVFTQLSPVDLAPLFESLKATKRLITAEEGTLSLGWGAEVAARSLESGVGELHLRRVAAREIPVPAAGALEAAMLPQVDDLVSAAIELSRRG